MTQLPFPPVPTRDTLLHFNDIDDLAILQEVHLPANLILSPGSINPALFKGYHLAILVWVRQWCSQLVRCTLV